MEVLLNVAEAVAKDITEKHEQFFSDGPERNTDNIVFGAVPSRHKILPLFQTNINSLDELEQCANACSERMVNFGTRRTLTQK